jgi:uncharacterized protein (TIGR02172 family)
MKTSYENSTLTVYLEGHIDSVNSPAIEKEIDDYLAQYSPASLILDAEKLDYISSAGLRVLLELRKKFSDLRVINVSNEVYEIFDVTGFAELMTVEKAYRTYDVTGCELIGEGANGKVYRVNRDTIVKVYKDASSLDAIKRERELSRTAFLLGVPTAIPYDVVKVGDTYGSVFELLNAKSFDELLREDAGNLGFVVEKSVEIMKIIHSTKAPENLPSQKDTVVSWIGQVEDYFTAEQIEKLRALIDAIPEEGMMMHGDLHIKNIMLQNGETLLIDMDTLCTGNPIYELAFIYNAYKGFGISDISAVEKFLKLPADLTYSLWRGILTAYLGTDDEAKINEAEEKASLIGLLRVMRRVIRIGEDKTDAGKKLIDTCHDVIADVLEKVDSLAI